MLNATYSFSPKHKISFNNLATILGDDQYLEREGHEIEQARLIKAYSMYYTSTSMINNQLTGEHEMSSNGSLLKWSIAHALVNKLTPSYRRMTYLKMMMAHPMNLILHTFQLARHLRIMLEDFIPNKMKNFIQEESILFILLELRKKSI